MKRAIAAALLATTLIAGSAAAAEAKGLYFDSVATR